MAENMPNPEFDGLVGRLNGFWRGAVAMGAAAFGLATYWIYQGPGLDWIWGVAAFGVGVVSYNLAFFIFCSAWAPEMAPMVKDDTRVEGDSVTHVVEHGATGDPRLDSYIQTYASARGISVAAIGAAVIAPIALTFF